jgi:hypothetical protein
MEVEHSSLITEQSLAPIVKDELGLIVNWDMKKRI